MTSQRVGRNPFQTAAQQAEHPRRASASATSDRRARSEPGLIPERVIELPIQLVFLGLKSLAFLRALFIPAFK